MLLCNLTNTYKPQTSPSFIIPYVLGFKDVGYAKDNHGTLPHLFIEFDAIYKPSKDPNDLDLTIANLYCSAGLEWPNNIKEYHAEADVDLKPEDWKELFDHIAKQFPSELTSLTTARFINFVGLQISQEMSDSYKNAIYATKK